MFGIGADPSDKAKADDGYQPPGAPAGSDDNGNSTSSSDDLSVWLPKWGDDIVIPQGGPAAKNMIVDSNSSVYNYASNASNAASEFASGEGYMGKDTTKWLNKVAHAIHPLKTGKSLWEDAVGASKSLWENHGVRKTPYQIVIEWAGEINPKASGGSNSHGSGRTGSGGGLGAATPSPDELRRAMDSVSMGLIGRSLSDKEFYGYYERFKGQFAATGGNMDAGQDMIEYVRKDRDYQEYQVATKFAGALESVLKGAL